MRSILLPPLKKPTMTSVTFGFPVTLANFLKMSLTPTVTPSEQKSLSPLSPWVITAQNRTEYEEEEKREDSVDKASKNSSEVRLLENTRYFVKVLCHKISVWNF